MAFKLQGYHKGFTLIEILVALVIVGILVAYAMPIYKQGVIRANRVSAQSQMMDIVSREQQFMFANRAYADSTTLQTSGFALNSNVSKNYTFTVTVDNTATPPIFTVTFTPIGSQSSDGVISIDGFSVKLPANKW